MKFKNIFRSSTLMKAINILCDESELFSQWFALLLVLCQRLMSCIRILERGNGRWFWTTEFHFQGRTLIYHEDGTHFTEDELSSVMIELPHENGIFLECIRRGEISGCKGPPKTSSSSERWNSTLGRNSSARQRYDAPGGLQNASKCFQTRHETTEHWRNIFELML